MSDLLVIVPSRGRPDNIAALHTAWQDTHATADLIVALDYDDPTRDRYPASTNPPSMYDIGHRTTSGMTEALNRVAITEAHSDRYRHIGFLGDDHRPRTPHWDQRIVETLDQLGTGLAYGNDLIHGENLPTAVFITADIIRALGYMAPPQQHHLFLDDAWLALGRALDAIRYLPDVIIEHMHPIVGKAPIDDGYTRVNDPSLYQHDRAEFERWRTEELPAAVEKIRAGTTVR